MAEGDDNLIKLTNDLFLVGMLNGKTASEIHSIGTDELICTYCFCMFFCFCSSLKEITVMFDGIVKVLEQPALYKETEVPFWDDDYISEQMLKAHLDPEFDGASRRLDFIETSVSWIKKMCPPQSYSALLDAGCGPGLYAERFARCGYAVTGVDFSRRSIRHAQNSAAQNGLIINYLCQNYLKLNLKENFDFAVMIYCDYGALSTENRRIFLENIYRCLKPGGKLLLDVFSMEKYNDFRESQTWEVYENGGFWREQGHIVLKRNFQYSDSVTLEQITVFSNEGAAAYYLWNTCFTNESLIKEVKESGFEVCGIYGDVAGNPGCEKSATIAVLLEK